MKGCQLLEVSVEFRSRMSIMTCIPKIYRISDLFCIKNRAKLNRSTHSSMMDNFKKTKSISMNRREGFKRENNTRDMRLKGEAD